MTAIHGHYKFLTYLPLACLIALGCNSGSSSLPSRALYSVTVSATGLTNSLTATLMINGVEQTPLTFAEDGSKTFSEQVSKDMLYNVTVTPPSGQLCTLTNTSGLIGANTTVAVTCASDADSHTLSGVVTGLAADKNLVLSFNNGSTQTVAAGAFTAETEFPNASAYAVTVLTQAEGKHCTVSNGSGTASADVTDVMVACESVTTLFNHTTEFTGNLGGRSGADEKCTARAAELPASALSCENAHAFLSIDDSDQIVDFPTLYNFNPANPVYAYNSDGDFNDDGKYLPILIEANWAGLMDGSWTAGLYFNWFWSGTDSDGNATTQTCDGFTSSSAASKGETGVNQQFYSDQADQCSRDWTIICACIQEDYQLGGTVAGLEGNLELTLTYGNAQSETLTLVGNGAFYFNTDLALGETYSVAVSSEPDGLVCVIENESGTIDENSRSDLNVTCTTPTTSYLFPTDTAVAGDFGGRAGADALCETTHTASYSELTCLGGIHAFLSVSYSDEIADMPSNYAVNETHAIYNAVNDTKVADDWSDLLDGTIDSALTVDWWSGTFIANGVNGTYSNFACTNWTVAGGDSATVGMSGETGEFWAGTSDGFCNESYRVMCLCYQ